MNIGILGTGTVGRALAARLDESGQAVMVGTRNVAETLARTASDAMGNPPFSTWRKRHPEVKLGTFAKAAGHLRCPCATPIRWVNRFNGPFRRSKWSRPSIP